MNKKSPPRSGHEVVCSSCGARHSVPQGDGRSVCASCGWVQPDASGNEQTVVSVRSRRSYGWVTLVAVVALGEFAWWYWYRIISPAADAASIAAVATPAKATIIDRGNRQVTVQDPKIRVVDEGLAWTLDELFAAKLPLFDTSALDLGKFERIIDETGLPTFRALLVNRSVDRVVINPIMALRLFSTDGTSQVPSSIVGLPPSMYPGEAAWIKIGDDEDIKPIKRVEATWHPSRGVPLPGPRRKATIDVKTNAMRTCHKRIINQEGDFNFTYQCVDMTGVVRNIDTRKMLLIGVRVTYYDDGGRYVGSESTDLDKSLNPGDQVEYDLHTKLLRKHGYKRYELQYYNR